MRAKLILAILALASLSSATVTWNTLAKSKPDEWNAKVRYPQFVGKSKLIAYANEAISKQAKEMLASFLKDVRELKADGIQPNVAYELEGLAEVDLDSPTVVSVHFVEYTFTGGAHPNHLLPASSFGIVDGKPARIRASDITSNLKGLSDRVLSKVKKKPGSDWVNEDEIKQLSKDQREMFVVTKKGLHFLFPPYEMGPYAAGSFEVDLSWSEIPGLKKTGVVAALLQRK
jgi:hypothetical protein